VQRPHPPVLIGGSKKRVLSFAAREADIVSLNNVAWADPDPLGEAERRVGFIRAAAGDRFDGLEVETLSSLCAITDDADELLERTAPMLRHADPKVLREHPNVLVGSVEQLTERLEHLRARLGVNYVTVAGSQVDAFAPVVARLAGR
jgi:alkanesulfonate monooxygenase SsuD/methylene tetrahydromethanopterin reductase-like flavin-dependent oxidoreductase (luciferase family)